MKTLLLVELAGLVVAQAIYYYSETQDWYLTFRDIWLPVGAALVLWAILFAISDVWRADVPALFGAIILITYSYALYNGKFGAVVQSFLTDINGNQKSAATSAAGVASKSAGGR